MKRLVLVGLVATAEALCPVALPTAPAARDATHHATTRNPHKPTMLVDDKAQVSTYFNNEGFDRWNRIYSEDGEVNSVQLDIRTGHQITVDKVLGWVDEDGSEHVVDWVLGAA